jgi:hypothetical protein
MCGAVSPAGSRPFSRSSMQRAKIALQAQLDQMIRGLAPEYRP